jgi:hypothetical protein
MALPGFTAEASIGPTTQAYRLSDRYGIASETELYAQSYADESEDAGFDEAADEDGMDDESFASEEGFAVEEEISEDI